VSVKFRGAVTFTVPLASIPAPRPRARTYGSHAFMYMPPEYTAWQKKMVEALAEVDLPADWTPLTGTIGVTLTVHGKKPKTTVRLSPAGDVDNHAKSILDAITKSERFWRDDEQVTTLTVTKRWAEGEPRVDITIYPMGDQ
jgi:Holliday junction resolvase RusA-like endonuclease